MNNAATPPSSPDGTEGTLCPRCRYGEWRKGRGSGTPNPFPLRYLHAVPPRFGKFRPGAQRRAGTLPKRTPDRDPVDGHLDPLLGRVCKLGGPAMMAPAMARQGTRGVRIGNTDDERNAGLPWPMPSPEGRRPEARLSGASPLKISPIFPAGLAPDNQASGRRRGAFQFANTP